MPSATADVAGRGMTREMRVISRQLGLGTKHDADVALAAFIASRRLPGENWQSWDAIGYDLREATGETVSREGVRRWAKRMGIPTETRADDGRELTAQYRRDLKRAGITL